VKAHRTYPEPADAFVKVAWNHGAVLLAAQDAPAAAPEIPRPCIGETHACVPSGVVGVTREGIDVVGAAPTERGPPPSNTAIAATHRTSTATITTNLYRFGQYHDRGPTRSLLLIIDPARRTTTPRTS